MKVRNFTGRHVLTYDRTEDGKIEIVITKDDEIENGTYVRLSRWDAFMTGIGIAWTALLPQR